MDAQAKLDFLDLDLESQAALLFVDLPSTRARVLQAQFRLIVRRAEDDMRATMLEATKITPAMIEALAEVLYDARAHASMGVCLRLAEKGLKAALGVE